MADTIAERSQIDKKYKWRLEDMYTTDEAWEKDFEKVYRLMDSLRRCTGRLGEGHEALLECLTLSDELSAHAIKVFAYARMRRDEDNRCEKYQSMTDRAAVMSADAGEACAFIAPEILALGEEGINAYVSECPDLEKYAHFFADILREKAHTLSAEEEKILAAAALLASARTFTPLPLTRP